MLKNMIADAGYTIRKFSKITGIPYSTINDITCDKVDIQNIRFGYAVKIANALNISLEELAGVGNKTGCIETDGKYSVIVKNKSYYICIPGYEPIKIGKINATLKRYIDYFASQEYECVKEQEIMESWRKNIIT